MNKEIVFVISDLSNGGAQKVFVRIANHLANKKKITLVTLYNKNDENFIINKKIKRIKLDFKSKNNFLSKIYSNLTIIFKLRKIIKRTNPESILSFLSTTNIITIFASIGLNKKIIISERNDPNFQKLNFFWNILRYFSYKLTDLIIINTKNAAKFLEKFVKSSKIVFIANPIKIEKFRVLERKKIILAVGRLTNQKGFDILIKAFKESKIYEQSWNLTIVGKGEQEKFLKNLTKELNIENFVSFPGYKKNLSNYYKTSSLFILPSRYEGMPNTLLEALAFKMPCMISNYCYSAFEFLEDKKSCIKIDINLKNQFTKFLRNIVSNKDTQNELSVNGYKALKKNFCDKKILDQWTKLL